MDGALNGWRPPLPKPTLAGFRTRRESWKGRSCRDFALSERLTVPGKRFLSPELNELRDEVEHTELIEQAIGNDKKVVIKFLARWCPSCRSMKRKLEVVAKEYPEFDFYSMDYDKNKELAKSLNITRLPYLEVIDGSRGLAGSFACGRSDLPYLKETLSSLVDEDLR